MIVDNTIIIFEYVFYATDFLTDRPEQNLPQHCAAGIGWDTAPGRHLAVDNDFRDTGCTGSRTHTEAGR